MPMNRYKRVKPLVLSEFCRQIGAMIDVGITLSKAMEILQSGTTDKKMKKLYHDLQDRMKQGSSFSDAMDEMGIFPEMMVNMFRAAEASGNLGEVSNRLAEHYLKEHRTDSRIKTATLYPKFLLVMSFVVILLVFCVVLPTVEPLFRGMDLPLITRVLIWGSAFVGEYWMFMIPIVVAMLVGIHFIFQMEKVRVWWDGVCLHVPVVGNLLKIICTARFARSQSSLYSSGLPMVTSLEIASRTVGNRYLEKEFARMIKKVQGGEPLSHAIESVDGLDKKLAPVIFVGEETGKLDIMLEGIADSYEKDSEVAITRLVSMVEPAMIVIMGIVIGIILLGIMMPMWSMYESLY